MQFCEVEVAIFENEWHLCNCSNYSIDECVQLIEDLYSGDVIYFDNDTAVYDNFTNGTNGCESWFIDSCYEDEYYFFDVYDCTANNTYNICDSSFNLTSCNATVEMFDGTEHHCDCFYEEGYQCDELYYNLTGLNQTNQTGNETGANDTE